MNSLRMCCCCESWAFNGLQQLIFVGYFSVHFISVQASKRLQWALLRVFAQFLIAPAVQRKRSCLSLAHAIMLDLVLAQSHLVNFVDPTDYNLHFFFWINCSTWTQSQHKGCQGTCSMLVGWLKLLLTSVSKKQISLPQPDLTVSSHGQTKLKRPSFIFSNDQFLEDWELGISCIVLSSDPQQQREKVILLQRLLVRDCCTQRKQQCQVSYDCRNKFHSKEVAFHWFRSKRIFRCW